MKELKKYIAIFDSGVGGLTVLHKAIELLPHEHFLYYADSANVPYGNKPNHEVMDLVVQACGHIMNYPVKALVIACNTATSIAIEELRKRYRIPIIGMEPAIKPAMSKFDPRKVLVFGTELTLKAEKYEDLIRSLSGTDKADAIPLQQLVDFAEEYDFESPKLKRYLKGALKSINWYDYHSVVLGCTHFIYYKPLFLEIIPGHLNILDGNLGTVRHLSTKIIKNPFGTPSEILCILSGMEVSTEVIKPYLNFLNGKHFRFFNQSN